MSAATPVAAEAGSATGAAPATGAVPAVEAATGGEAVTGAEAAAGAFTIRRAQPADYAAIDELIVAAYAHDYGERGPNSDPLHRAETRDRAFDVWVASDEAGELLGSVTLRRAGGPALHEDFAAHELDLRLLGVSPRARRRGVGAALMQHAAKVAAATGFSAVTLKTGPNMTGAHRLYESLGFARAPERDGLWIGGERVFDLFTYVLPVAAAPLVSADVADIDQARGVLGRFPSGVALITGGGDEPGALILQSFVSLSVDPPRVLLSVGRGSTSWPRIAAGGVFAATVLAEHQGELARNIARSKERDKLSGLNTQPTPTHNLPVLVGGSAWFECEVRETFDGGDHLLVIADVLAYGHLGEADRPAVFSSSRFGGVRQA